MKQKFLALILMIAVIFTCTSCAEKKQEITPTETRMRSICELATLECYYHNVAKFMDEDASGVLFWKKDKHFWVEYSGVVEIGIDVSQVEIAINGTQVDITLPKAEVLSSRVDESSLTSDSYIVAQDSAKIDADDETMAFAQAQSDMLNLAQNDAKLLSNALDRAEKLLSDYVGNIGEATGKSYNVSFHVIESEDSSVSSTASSEASLAS